MGHQYRTHTKCIAAAVFALLVATTTIHAKEREDNRPLSAEELQIALMSFADSWASHLGEATALMVKRVGTPEARLHADRFGLYAMAAAFDIAVGPYPGPALLDMLVLATLNRMVWEEYWMPKVYGQSAAMMVTTLRGLEGDIWTLAAKVLTAAQRRELRELLRAWRDKYPDKTGVSFIRFSDFGELGRKPSLEAARKAGGLLAPVKQAVQAADDIRILGERALYLAMRLQELVSARAKLTVEELLRAPEIAQLLSDINGFRAVSERYAKLLEALPVQLNEQTQATIDQTMTQITRQAVSIIENTMQQVSAERYRAIEQSMRGIGQEREMALEQVLQGLSAERRALLVGIDQVLARGEGQAERWVTHGFVLLAALILIFFATRLAYRYAADYPVDAPSRPWAASAGLGVLAILFTVAALAYVRRDLPPMSNISPLEQAAEVSVESSPDTPSPQPRPAKPQGEATVKQGTIKQGASPGSDTAPVSPSPAAPIPAKQPSRIAEIKQRGRLIAAVQENFQPFSFLDAEQQRIGFDIDLVREFAKRWLGDADAVTFVPVTTDRRIPILLDGKVDLIAAALTITPARRQQIAFSHTYFQDGQRLLVREGSEVNDICDLQGQPIAITRGSTAIDNVLTQASVCGYTAKLYEAETHAEGVAAVLTGQAAAFSTDGLALEQFAAGQPLKVAGNHFSEEPYGIGLPKGDETFRRLVDLTLEAMAADGALAAVYQKWFQDSLRPYPIPAFDKGAVEPELLALATTNATLPLSTRQEQVSPVKQYVVQGGDTLSRVAGKVYGDVSPQAWKRIYNANQTVIGPDPSRLRIGMQLIIPEF